MVTIATAENTIAAEEPPETAPPTDAQMVQRNQKYRLPGDQVYKATQHMPDAQRSAIRWLHHHGVDNNLDLEELGAMIKQPGGKPYSRDSVYQLLTGRREAGIEKMVQAIERLKKLIESRRVVNKLGFIETSLTRKIFSVCEAALTYQKIVQIFGDSQIGKTEALEEYARQNNHGQTIYVRVPEGGGLNYFMASLADRLGFSSQQKIPELRARAIASFDSRMLLIVDEIHNIFSTGTNLTHFRVPEFIREIYDRTKCGVVISGTNVFEAKLAKAAGKKLFDQFQRRSLCKLQLPNIPTDDDLDTFAAAHGLPPATGEAFEAQTTIITHDGLGVWLTYLRAGSHMATKKNNKFTWEWVLKARDTILALGEMKGAK